MEKLKEALHIAFANIFINAVRSILSVLGIVIGIASVITILAIGAGVKQFIMEKINAQGANVLVLSPNYDSQSDRMGYFEMDDVDRIQNLPFVITAVPRVNAYKEIRSRQAIRRGDVLGVDSNYISGKLQKIVEGRNFSPIDVESRNTFCLLNLQTREELFPQQEAVGQSIFMDGVPWVVIGVYTENKKSRSVSRGGEIEILTPITTLIRSAKDITIRNIDVQVKENAMADAPQNLKEALVRGDPNRENLFTIRDQKSLYARSLETQKLLSIIGTIIAGISLIVGGIGMMNVMLTSVAERTREIGLRRALGARKKDVLIQFLVESCVLSGMGGLLGLILGVTMARVLPAIFTDFFTQIPRVQPGFLFVAVAGGFVLGLCFGLYPAVKASRLSPAEALRTE
jgi:putative ABC transport system permease protein